MEKFLMKVFAPCLVEESIYYLDKAQDRDSQQGNRKRSADVIRIQVMHAQQG
jgi:hypothetical protein